MNNKEIGDRYEQKAVNLLKNNGYIILERNYRLKIGEIDIIAQKDGVIVFVEVKYRKNSKFGYGIEAVDLRKIRKIFKVAQIYILREKKQDFKLRFDCISFLDEKITWTKNLTWGDEIGF